MRLSTMPRVSFAGSCQLVNGSGVDTTNLNWSAVTDAAAGDYVTNTQKDPFGYYLSAQGSAEAVAYWALNRSTAVYATTVGANCPLVSMDTNGITTMPAVYAQAYQGDNGKRYVDSIKLYEAITTRAFAVDEPIDFTALVELDASGARSLYFIGPKNGGLEIEHLRREITVITPPSPLGQNLLGKKAGHRWTAALGGSIVKYRIVSMS
jgi:hypothetical protein